MYNNLSSDFDGRTQYCAIRTACYFCSSVIVAFWAATRSVSDVFSRVLGRARERVTIKPVTDVRDVIQSARRYVMDCSDARRRLEVHSAIVLSPSRSSRLHILRTDETRTAENANYHVAAA